MNPKTAAVTKLPLSNKVPGPVLHSNAKQGLAPYCTTLVSFCPQDTLALDCINSATYLFQMLNIRIDHFSKPPAFIFL
jgi:hypothetical protein